MLRAELVTFVVQLDVERFAFLPQPSSRMDKEACSLRDNLGPSWSPEEESSSEGYELQASGIWRC